MSATFVEADHPTSRRVVALVHLRAILQHVWFLQSIVASDFDLKSLAQILYDCADTRRALVLTLSRSLRRRTPLYGYVQQDHLTAEGIDHHGQVIGIDLDPRHVLLVRRFGRSDRPSAGDVILELLEMIGMNQD